jgi:hypothetical protein
MAVVVGGLALLVVLILALVGHGPNPAVGLLIVLLAAFVGGVGVVRGEYFFQHGHVCLRSLGGGTDDNT